MKLYTINTGYFKLDGGAMFGVVPKSLWQRTNPADQNNLCTWAMRSLLIEQENKLILIDTGIGDKQSENFFKHYYLHGDDSLQKSINSLGFSFDQITDVILTHLHMIKRKININLHLKMLIFGQVRNIGNGQLTPIAEKRRLF